MKQLILLTATLLTSTIAFAQETTTTETCADGAGTVVTGAVSGRKYCLSKKTMNWWNANAWCDALGMKLFNLKNCGCNALTNCTGRCPEIKNINFYPNFVWSEPLTSNAQTYRIRTGDGILMSTDLGDPNNVLALCH